MYKHVTDGDDGQYPSPTIRGDGKLSRRRSWQTVAADVTVEVEVRIDPTA